MVEQTITYQRETKDGNVELEIDRHFYGMTALNNPGEALEAEYVANLIIPRSRY
jgi:hypothetical protein